jgi:hypothetical protein
MNDVGPINWGKCFFWDVSTPVSFGLQVNSREQEPETLMGEAKGNRIIDPSFSQRYPFIVGVPDMDVVENRNAFAVRKVDGVDRLYVTNVNQSGYPNMRFAVNRKAFRNESGRFILEFPIDGSQTAPKDVLVGNSSGFEESVRHNKLGADCCNGSGDQPAGRHRRDSQSRSRKSNDSSANYIVLYPTAAERSDEPVPEWEALFRMQYPRILGVPDMNHPCNQTAFKLLEILDRKTLCIRHALSNGYPDMRCAPNRAAFKCNRTEAKRGCPLIGFHTDLTGSWSSDDSREDVKSGGAEDPEALSWVQDFRNRYPYIIGLPDLSRSENLDAFHFTEIAGKKSLVLRFQKRNGTPDCRKKQNIDAFIIDRRPGSKRFVLKFPMQELEDKIKPVKLDDASWRARFSHDNPTIVGIPDMTHDMNKNVFKFLEMNGEKRLTLLYPKAQGGPDFRFKDNRSAFRVEGEGDDARFSVVYAEAG